jgi:hypothetical protein
MRRYITSRPDAEKPLFVAESLITFTIYEVNPVGSKAIIATY